MMQTNTNKPKKGGRIKLNWSCKGNLKNNSEQQIQSKQNSYLKQNELRQQSDKQQYIASNNNQNRQGQQNLNQSSQNSQNYQNNNSNQNYQNYDNQTENNYNNESNIQENDLRFSNFNFQANINLQFQNEDDDNKDSEISYFQMNALSSGYDENYQKLLEFRQKQINQQAKYQNEQKQEKNISKDLLKIRNILLQDDKYLLNFKQRLIQDNQGNIFNLKNSFRPAIFNTIDSVFTKKNGKICKIFAQKSQQQLKSESSIFDFISQSNSKEVATKLFESLVEIHEYAITQEQQNQKQTFLPRNLLPLLCDTYNKKYVNYKNQGKNVQNSNQKHIQQLMNHEIHQIALLNIFFGEIKFDFVRKIGSNSQFPRAEIFLKSEIKKNQRPISENLLKERFLGWAKSYLQNYYSEIFQSKYDSLIKCLEVYRQQNKQPSKSFYESIEQILLFKIAIGDLEFIRGMTTELKEFPEIYEFYGILNCQNQQDRIRLLSQVYVGVDTQELNQKIYQKRGKDVYPNLIAALTDLSNIYSNLYSFSTFNQNTNNPFWIIYIILLDYNNIQNQSLEQLFNEAKKIISSNKNKNESVNVEFEIMQAYFITQNTQNSEKEVQYLNLYKNLNKNKKNHSEQRLAWLVQQFLYSNLFEEQNIISDMCAQEIQSVKKLWSEQNEFLKDLLRTTIQTLQEKLNRVEQAQLFELSPINVFTNSQKKSMIKQIFSQYMDPKGQKIMRNAHAHKYIIFENESFIEQNYSQFNFTINLAEKLRDLISNNFNNNIQQQTQNYSEKKRPLYVKMLFNVLLNHVAPKIIMTNYNISALKNLLSCFKTLTDDKFIFSNFNAESQTLIMAYKWFLQLELNQLGEFQEELSMFGINRYGKSEGKIQGAMKKCLKILKQAIQNLQFTDKFSEQCYRGLVYINQASQDKLFEYEKTNKLSIFRNLIDSQNENNDNNMQEE